MKLRHSSDFEGCILSVTNPSGSTRAGVITPGCKQYTPKHQPALHLLHSHKVLGKAGRALPGAPEASRYQQSWGCGSTESHPVGAQTHTLHPTWWPGALLAPFRCGHSPPTPYLGTFIYRKPPRPAQRGYYASLDGALTHLRADPARLRHRRDRF